MLSPSEDMLDLILNSNAFSAVKTEMIAKIPMVMPNNVRKVLSLFAITEL